MSGEGGGIEVSDETPIRFVGVPLTKVKDAFVATMAVVFAVELLGHFVGIFGTGTQGDINLLLALVLTEVPLWFAQVVLWGRGEAIWETNRGVIFRSMQTLDNIGFLFDYCQPAIEALREYRSKLTPEQYRVVQASMYGGALAGLNLGLERVAENDPDLIHHWLETWEERRNGPR